MFDINTAAFCSHHDSYRNRGQDLVPIELVTQVVAELKINFRERIFTPFVTLFAFLSQVFSDDHSCRHAVMEVYLLRCRQGLSKCSLKTTSYCDAKARLPLDFFSSLTKRVAWIVESLAETAWTWRHGRVLVIDGTGVSLPDTDANNACFSKHTSQKNKVGFPIARVTALFSLASGALIDLAIASWTGKGNGELSLVQRLLHNIAKGDTLLGDCLYSSYSVIAQLLAKQAHVVAEFRPSRAWRLRRNLADQIIKIDKPKSKPISLSDEEFEALPETITVRVVHLRWAPKGFRVQSKYILTTHLDPKVTVEDIGNLYRQRWRVELNLRSIKNVMGMDIIRGKTPDIVIKEIWVHMLGYNLIRMAMAWTGKLSKRCPQEISFRAVQQWFAIVRMANAYGANLEGCAMEMLLLIADAEVVGHRPNRYEPRARKRRPKNYNLLNENRKTAQLKLYKKHGRPPSVR